MARLLDYQFDNFSVDANGNRVIVNAGTLGSSNDAVMHTGQGLEFDGTDDYIKTSFYWSHSDNAVQVRGVFKTVSTYDETLYQNIAGTETANSNAGGYLFSSISDSKWMVYQGGVNSGSAVSPNTFYRTCTALDANDIKFYVNGSLDISASAPDMTNNDTPLWIGCRTKSNQSGALIYFNGVQSNIIYVDVTPTADDIAYDAQHPDALLNMVLSGTDDPNFSFGVSNVILCAPLMEGTGHTAYNIKDGTSLAMTNFPTDDTQWTNADEQSTLVQKERYKKDAHGNPSAPADPNTVRFD